MAPLDEQPREEFLGEYGSMRTYKNKRGIDICQYYWPAKPGVAPKGIVVLAHGHGGYIQFDYLLPRAPGQLSVYAGSFVSLLNDVGYCVAGADDRGAGRSGGLRCYCDAFTDYVDELVEVARVCTTLGIRSFEPGLPVFACGGSKGGCVVLTAVLTEPSLFAGVIALAPMVSLEKVAKKGLNPYLRPLGALLSLLIPTAALLSTDRCTKFPDLQEQYDKDPDTYHMNTRVRTAQEYLRATEWLVANQARLALPMLLFHSDGDTMTDHEGTARLYEAAASADKTFIKPPNMWHILLKEPGNEQIKAQIVSWLDAHSTPSKTA